MNKPMTDVSSPTDAGEQRTVGPSIGALAVRETALALPYAPPPAMYPMPGADAESEGGLNTRRLLHALRRRWLPAVVVGSLLASLGAVGVYLFLPRGYEAVVWLRVRSAGTMLGGAGDALDYKAYRKTQIQLLKSPVVLNAALRRPGIASLRTISDEDDPLRWLSDTLEADSQSESEVLQLKLRAPVAEEAAKILNAVTTCYLDDIVNKDRQERLARRDTLEKKYRENQTELRDKKEKANQLAKTLGTRGSEEVETTKSLMREHLSQLRATLYGLKQELRNLEEDMAAAAALRQEDRESDFQADGSSEDGSLEFGQLIENALSRDPDVRSLTERIGQYTDVIQSQSERSARGLNEPAVRRMIAQQRKLVEELSELKERLRPMVIATISGGGGVLARSPAVNKVRHENLQKTIDETQREFDDVTEQVTKLGMASAELDLKRSEIEQLEKVNNQIGLQLETTAIDLTAPSRVTLLEEASVPTSDDALKRVLLSIGAGLVGLLAGAASVIFVEYSRNRLSGPDEIPQAVGLKVVGTIPWIGSSKREREGEYRVAESVDGIRTMLLNSGNRAAPKVILVTSPGEREGKSAVAANLAASIARSEKRTLLIEGSLRNPSVQSALQLDPAAQGMAELLRQEVVDPNAVVQPTQIDGLFAVAAGDCDYDAVVALSKPEFAKIMQSYRDTFDHVVIDAGSIVASADPLIIGQHCDVALLCTMRDVSSIPSISAAVDRIRSAGIRLVGCVVCGTRDADPGWRKRRIAG